jgi:hypothetical protein
MGVDTVSLKQYVDTALPAGRRSGQPTNRRPSRSHSGNTDFTAQASLKQVPDFGSKISAKTTHQMAIYPVF